MLRPSRPMRRSINGQRRESSNADTAKGSLSSQRTSWNPQETLPSSTGASTATRVVTAPSELNAFPNAMAKPVVSPLSSQHCPGEPYKGSDACGASPAQWLASSSPGTTADFVDGAAVAATAAATANADVADGIAERLPSPLKVSKPQYSCLNGILEEADRQACMPSNAQRLFTSSEIVTLRREARQTYTHRLIVEEQKKMFANEKDARSSLAEAAFDQIAAVVELEKEAHDLRMQATSEKELPFLYLEERIRRRTAFEMAQRERQLRQEGREAWRLQVMRDKAAAEEAIRREMECRAEVNRFRAALTFIVVEEMRLRRCLEAETTDSWEAFAQEEADSRADAERLELERFYSSPEQLAIREACEQRERKQARRAAKLLKLFKSQQAGFVKGCRHGSGGESVFVGDEAVKMCRRCRVKWDDDLGYYVSLDAAVKVHRPPPPSTTTSTGGDVKKALVASKRLPAETTKRAGVLPSLKKASN